MESSVKEIRSYKRGSEIFGRKLENGDEVGPLQFKGCSLTGFDEYLLIGGTDVFIERSKPIEQEDPEDDGGFL